MAHARRLNGWLEGLFAGAWHAGCMTISDSRGPFRWGGPPEYGHVPPTKLSRGRVGTAICLSSTLPSCPPWQHYVHGTRYNLPNARSGPLVELGREEKEGSRTGMDGSASR